MAKADLTAARLRELLSYNPGTGVFIWRVDRRRRVKAGAIAGWTATRGKRLIEIDQHNYAAHRLAFLYMTGEWPINVVDHKNGIPADNRWENLRDVTQSVNLQNQRRARAGAASPLLGAFLNASRKCWTSAICVDGVVTNLGRFATAEEASAAYLAAKRRLHEGCTI